MGKGKPRHNPNKPQNKYGNVCKCYLSDGGYYCPTFRKSMKDIIDICHLNPHNCSKVKYRLCASAKNKDNKDINVHCCNVYENYE